MSAGSQGAVLGRETSVTPSAITSALVALAFLSVIRLRSLRRRGGSMSGLNIADIFETVVATVPDHPALVVRTGDGHDEVRFSFAELDARVNRLAHALRRRWESVKATTSARHLYDGNQYIEVTLAAYKVRAVPVNVNFRYVDEELTYLFDNADLKVVFTEPDLEDRAARAAATLAWTCPVVAPTSATKRCSRDSPTPRPTSATARPTITTASGPAAPPGMPKGVIWRQEDIYLSAIGGNGNPLLGIDPVKNLDDVAAQARKGTPLPGTLTLCPLMHGGGFWLAFSAILSGSFSVLIRDVGFDPDVRAARDRRGTRQPADDDRRRVRATDRRPARDERRPTRSTCRRCSSTDRAARSCRRR